MIQYSFWPVVLYVKKYKDVSTKFYTIKLQDADTFHTLQLGHIMSNLVNNKTPLFLFEKCIYAMNGKMNIYIYILISLWYFQFANEGVIPNIFTFSSLLDDSHLPFSLYIHECTKYETYTKRLWFINLRPVLQHRIPFRYHCFGVLRCVIISFGKVFGFLNV